MKRRCFLLLICAPLTVDALIPGMTTGQTQAITAYLECVGESAKRYAAATVTATEAASAAVISCGSLTGKVREAFRSTMTEMDASTTVDDVQKRAHDLALRISVELRIPKS